ncbi:MAG: transglutaminase domain-containing protein, partial [Candidatus Electrothrix sp. AR4]|nr:transglutaminase domain-containing protein [Candidatus Electrothrix sp. AR4]
LLVLLVRRDFFVTALSNDDRAALILAKYQQYYGVHLYNKRIGYVVEDVRPHGDNGFRIRQQASLRLKVLDTVQPVNMELTAEVDSGLGLNTFDFSFSSPFYSTTANGRTEGNTVHFTLDTGQTIIKDSITLPGPPLLPLNQRGYLLSKMHEAGDKLKIPFFDPFSLSSRESVITYKGKKKQLLNNRIHNLHHFSETYSGMQINFWLDDQGKIIKEKSPAGFIFQAEPKFKAMDIRDSGDELLAAVAVQYSGKLLPKNSSAAIYKLQFPEKAEVKLNGGRQQFSDGKLILTKETFPLTAVENAVQAENTCAANEGTLQATRYVQSENPDIIEQAKKIIGAVTDPAQQASLLAEWVYTNIDKRPVIGLPDALTTLKNRRGDCNEHAALFAALARSLNIPTAIAAGVTLHNNAFYYHAWNEICVGGQWISLDTTTDQLPADLYHIRFTRGDLEGQLAIGALIGKLQIEILPAKE